MGNQLAAYLTAEDQKTAQAAAIRTASTGQPIRWNGNGTGVTGSTRVSARTTERKPANIPVYKDRVKTMPALELIGETYQAKGKTPVRGGPATDYVEVDNLSAGETVTVVGKVKGSDWVLVSDGNAASGFVPMSKLKPAGQAMTSTAPDGASPAGPVEVARVEAESDCRTIDQSVVLANGDKKTESVTVCRGPNGWVPQG